MNRTQAQPAPPRLLPRRVWDRIEAHHDALADPQRVRRAARQLKALAARCRLSWRRDQPGHLDVRNCWDGRDVDVLRDRLMNTRNGSAIDLAPALLDAGRLAVPADVAAPWRHLGREETVLAMDHRGMVLVRIRETVVPMDAPPHLRTRYRTLPLSVVRERRRPRPTPEESERALRDGLAWWLSRATYALWSARTADPDETIEGRVLAATRRHIVQEDAAHRQLVVRQRIHLGANGLQDATDTMLDSPAAFRLGPAADVSPQRHPVPGGTGPRRR